MRVADAATLKGDGRTNQDRYLAGDYYAAVLDGASSYPPLPEGRDGGWYAEQLARAIEDAITPTKALDVVLAEAIELVAETHQLESGASPSSTVAIARWDGSYVECLVLGDSTILVGHTDGTIDRLTDDRLTDIAVAQRAEYQRRLQQGHGYDQQHRKLLQALQQEQRRARNTKDGYWIAEADPVAAYHALERRYPQREIADLVLMTDGAAAVAEPLQIIPWNAVASVARAAGCGEILRSVVAAEGDDPDGREFPRSKRHDDKAAVLITAAT